MKAQSRCDIAFRGILVIVLLPVCELCVSCSSQGYLRPEPNGQFPTNSGVVGWCDGAG